MDGLKSRFGFFKRKAPTIKKGSYINFETWVLAICIDYVSAVSVENNSSPKIKRKHIDLLHKNSPKEIQKQKSVFHQFRKVSHVPSRDRSDEVTSSSDNSLDSGDLRVRKPSLVTRRQSPPPPLRSRDDLRCLNTPVTVQRQPQPVRALHNKPSCGELIVI